MSKLSKQFFTFSNLKDEIIFISGISVAWLFIATASITGIAGLIISLLIIISVTLYYSLTFFRDGASWNKLYFYVVMLPFLLGYFALIYMAFGVVTPDSNNVSGQLDWLDAYYFSVVTWTTLGYGDFRPANAVTKIFVIIEVLLGYIYMGVFIGKLFLLGQNRAKE